MTTKNQKREMFVFVGQNASTGTPHPTTGHMSYYGTVYSVDGTLRQAREWADMMELRDFNNRICVAGGRRKMREFCLGQTMYCFEQTLNEAPAVFPDDSQNACDWNIA